MKIIPVSICSIASKDKVQEKSTNPVSYAKTQREQITQLSNIYYQPVNFTSKQKRTVKSSKPHLKERSGDFVIAKINGIRCPACGQKMMNQSIFEKFTQELSEVEPEKYLEFLGDYTEYMRPIEASVYKEICAESKRLGTTDIRSLVVSLRDNKLPVLQEAQLRLVKKMTSLAKSLPADEQKALMSKIQKLKSEIKKKNSTAPFRRKIMLDRISKVKISNPKKYEKLQRIAANFPTSSDMNSAWIVKYSGKNKFNEDWDSYTIATRFLQSSVANTDHILAYATDNTHDDISNYMAMHNACNSQKANKSFLQWLNEDKDNRIKYMQQYFDDCDKVISSKIIGKKKYKNYVAYATQTVFEVSKGQVDIIPQNVEAKETQSPDLIEQYDYIDEEE